MAATAGERLGFPHNPPDAVAATRDKAADARARWPRPRSRSPRSRWSTMPTTCPTLGFPCVVKPLDLSGSQGVIRADDADVGARGRAPASARSPTAPLLVEQYVPGVEVAVEGLLRDGELEVLAVFDKPDPLDGPYFEETIYVTPSRLDAVGAGRACRRRHRDARARRSGWSRDRSTPSCASTATARARDRGRGALDRRAVRAHAALRRRHLARGADPAPRARPAARRPGARAGRPRA